LPAFLVPMPVLTAGPRRRSHQPRQSRRVS
jgi:hypothetical protein